MSTQVFGGGVVGVCGERLAILDGSVCSGASLAWVAGIVCALVALVELYSVSMPSGIMTTSAVPISKPTPRAVSNRNLDSDIFVDSGMQPATKLPTSIVTHSNSSHTKGFTIELGQRERGARGGVRSVRRSPSGGFVLGGRIN